MRVLVVEDDHAMARSIELMAAIALAWQVHYRTGEAALPNSGVPFTSSAFPAVVALAPARSLTLARALPATRPIALGVG